MLSFWERQSFLNYDYIVVGGGIVGLSTAIAIRERKPKCTIAILERDTFPSGASTKNAGFACFGSLTEILDDLSIMTADEVCALVEFRWKGLALLKQRLGKKGIGLKTHGGYELLFEGDLKSLESIDRVNSLLKPLFNEDIYCEKKEQLGQFGFDSNRVKSLIFNPLEAQIDTGLMMKNLEALAQQLKIKIFTSCDVQSFSDHPSGVDVLIKGDVTFRCKKLAICSNAFTKKLLPDTDLVPGRGVALVTKPIKGLPFKGTFHYDEGYYYFRNFKDRVIFGGGRNLDLNGEESTEFEIKELILDKLKKDLEEIILPQTPFEVDYAWAGIMAFGKTKQPIVKMHSQNIALGVRLGGMGVAIGSKVGERLATMMLE
jgi:glycine/D-amino acid oxidase-like deaminating enzyme